MALRHSSSGWRMLFYLCLGGDASHFSKIVRWIGRYLCGNVLFMSARRLNAELANELRESAESVVRVAPRWATEPHRGIVHFGVGAFHRSHLAVYLDDLAINQGGQSGTSSASHGPRASWSITGTGVTPTDQRIADVLAAQDGYYTLVERSGERANARIIGSIPSFSRAVPDPCATIKLLADPSTSIVSLTITEGGYPVRLGAFDLTESLASDLVVETPRTTFGIIVAALEQRKTNGLAPFTVLSCDNLPGNGHVVKMSVLGAATTRSDALATWIERNGAFPNGMVDRITPATTDADRAFVEDTYGIVDQWPVVCEPFRQWALEDNFVTDRPRFEDVGVLMTTDVIPYEHMKLRLLNGSHSALAYLAALAGIDFVHTAVQDVRIERYIRALMATEAAPTLTTPAGVDLVAYQDELVRRFSNPAIADTIARLCLDGTAKMPTFILETLKHQLRVDGPIDMLVLALAGWCRYLQGRADDGSPIRLSNDPYLDEAREAALASKSSPRKFLTYRRVFGDSLSMSDRLNERFDAAMHSLTAHGALMTLEQWTPR